MRAGVTVFGRRSWRVIVMCLSGCCGLVADNPDTGYGMLHYASVTHCPLHGAALREGLIPWVEGGMPTGFHRDKQTEAGSSQPEYEWEAEPREFPFAHDRWSSGCCWDPRMAYMKVRVRYCQTCRDVQSKWRLENPTYAWRPHDPSQDGPVIGGDDEDE